MKRIRARQLSDGTWLSRTEGSDRCGAGKTYEEADLRRCYGYWFSEAISRGEELRHAGEEIEDLKRDVGRLHKKNTMLLSAVCILGAILITPMPIT